MASNNNNKKGNELHRLRFGLFLYQMLRKSTMKQNNLLRVYMKLEQQSYLGQMGFQERGGRGRVKEHLGGNEKMRKTQSFQCWICSADHSAVETQRPFSVQIQIHVPSMKAYFHHTLFFSQTAYQNGRTKMEKGVMHSFQLPCKCLASCTSSPTYSCAQS